MLDERAKNILRRERDKIKIYESPENYATHSIAKAIVRALCYSFFRIKLICDSST